MRSHRTNSSNTANAPRAWRVITIVAHNDGEDECAIVHAIQSYELALHQFNQLKQSRKPNQSVELRDPSGRSVFFTGSNTYPTEPLDDGLLEVPSGTYLYAYATTQDRDDCNGRFTPLTPSEVQR